MNYKNPSDMLQRTWAAIIVGGTGIALGAAEYAHGVHQSNLARKSIAGLKYPNQAPSQDLLNNQSLAQQNAQTGLPSEQYKQAQQNIKNQQMMALQESQDRRGGLALIGGIQAQGNAADLNLDAMNAQQRLKNDNALYGINGEVAQNKDDVWNNNVKQKYITDYNYAYGLLGSGQQNKSSGMDTASSGFEKGASIYAMNHNPNKGGSGGVNNNGGTTSGGNYNYGISDDAQYV